MGSDAEIRFELSHVARRIRLLRDSTGLSVAEFAKEVGSSYRQIKSWEVGRNHPPVTFLISVRHCFDVDPEWILFGPGDVPLRSVTLSDLDRSRFRRSELAGRAAALGFCLRPETLDELAEVVRDDNNPRLERLGIDFAMNVLSAVYSDRSNSSLFRPE